MVLTMSCPLNMPLALLLLLLSHAAAGLGGGGDSAAAWSAVTRPSPVFPVNHRRPLDTASSSDINSLVIPDTTNHTRSPTTTKVHAPPPQTSSSSTTPSSILLRTTKAAKATVPSKRAAEPEIPPMLRQEPWVLPLLVLAAISLVTMAGFETATPSAATCAVTRLGVGLAYAIVFASLLVKSVFLISLNGGVYLPAPYQALLLLFAVLIQVAVGSQWLLNSPPRVQQHVDLGNVSMSTPRPTSAAGTRHVITASDVTPVKGPSVVLGPSVALCGTPYSETLAALIYVVFLMGFVGVLAAKSRGIRENYRESTYIGLSLAAMGRDGRYAEDGGEERFSSLSPSAVAGYSPSFFHFKPAAAPLPTKQGPPPALYPPHLMGDRVALVQAPPPPLPPSYPRILHYYPCLYYPPRYHPGLYMKPDDGNMYTTLEPTLSSNPNVFFQRGGVHPGMMY
ncbi:hypothetical protein B566_EDAN001480 [Ephemera danica]|nr:hypothetical protein B566_EDAN001480 [Ephemera danica]